ncbi:MAG: FHA domain-containing serine/threonine-protein kinase [Muribaculaceae bacterium]|nr:FHA domain-containing serine/threonine-protein kinase [Muribaculaceae bacterium]
MSEYKIIKEIGRGGMGCVYEARNSANTPIALKMMTNQISYNPEFRELFISEAQALRKMNSQAVVHIMGEPYTDAQGNMYLPMEYVNGETIASHVENQGIYTEAQAIELMLKVLKGFEYVHRHGCIHRDIKPSNIMVRQDDSICIIDFGIAKDAHFTTGKTLGRIIGTDGYMSPEQANGLSIDHRTDIYSLGCLLHFMLVGQHAIAKKSNDVAMVASILQDTFPSAREITDGAVSEGMQEVIFKAVDKNMMNRYQSATEFKEALKNLQHIENDNNSSESIVITVGRKDCDIVMPENLISSTHLIIEYTPQSEGATIKVTDSSTNGTQINGSYLHHSFIFFESLDSLLESEILLAQRREFKLSGELLKNTIEEKIMRQGEIKPSQPTSPNETRNTINDTFDQRREFEEIEEGFDFISKFFLVLLPPIALIYWLINRETKVRKSSQAIDMMFRGIAIWAVVIIFSMIQL